MFPKRIQDILAEQETLPLGDFESLPVRFTTSGAGTDYPLVLRLGEVCNVPLLTQEAWAHIDLIGTNFVNERVPHLDPRISIEELMPVLAHIGFKDGLYHSYSLRKLGTAELHDFVLPATRQFFADIGVRTFRQQYSIAMPGWKTRLHNDHADFRKHGFRGIVPLNLPVYLGFLHDGQRIVYRLDPGGVYFINIVRPHWGFSLSDPRVALFFQMDEDKLLLSPSAQPLAALQDLSGIPEDCLHVETIEYA